MKRSSEAALQLVAELENNIGDTGWHRDLLERMTLNIEGLRKQLFLRALAEELRD